MRIGLRKEQIKTIILCKDKEFKKKTIQMLNNAAFVAEKFSAETMPEALSILAADLNIDNIVIDASSQTREELKTALELYRARQKNGDPRVIIYLNQRSTAQDQAWVEQALPEAQVFLLPEAQLHFNKALYAPKRNQPLVLAEKPTEKDKAATHPQSSPTGLIEASAHIKETVDLLNSIAKDHSRLDILQQIGQRFNGLIGTFAFFANLGPYAKIRDLATVIDGVARNYEEATEATTISEQHWQLLLESAKVLYKILKLLRDNQDVDLALQNVAGELYTNFERDASLSKRQSNSQEDIDNLLDALAADPNSLKVG